MKHILRTLVIILAASSSLPSAAQKYPSADSAGVNVYYRIVNAASEYSRYCLSDNTAKAGTGGYSYTLEPIDLTDNRQQWWIVAQADDNTETHYYLRNRSSRKYISPLQKWIGNYSTPSSVTTRITLSPFTFEDVGEGQIAIKYYADGDTRYYFAADSAAEAPTFNRFDMKNTVWAWKVYNAKDEAVSISKIISNANVRIEVENRRIKVYGADRYAIFSDDGTRMPADAELSPGIYFVNAAGISFKTLVK